MCQPNTPDPSRINPIVTLQQKSQRLSLLMQFSETQFQRFINHVRWVCVSRSTKGHTYLPHKRVAKLLSWPCSPRMKRRTSVLNWVFHSHHRFQWGNLISCPKQVLWTIHKFFQFTTKKIQQIPTQTPERAFIGGGWQFREAHKFFGYSLQKFSSKDLYMMFFYLANTIDWWASIGDKLDTGKQRIKCNILHQHRSA